MAVPAGAGPRDGNRTWRDPLEKSVGTCPWIELRLGAVSDSPVKEGDMLAGKYRIDQVLGVGGMGVVVAATDVQLERRVAIKFVLNDFSAHPEAYTRFLREARAAVKIHSEHVARVFDVGTMDDGAPYMVLEYLQGADLSEHAERGDLDPPVAVSYILQACEAIAEAHAAGIVHRDLKPANLYLAKRPDNTSSVKVLDFGISKTTLPGGAEQIALTQTSSMMGSPLYMSPEQMQSSRNVDGRTDIWALGAILYELLSATPPFTAESVPQLCVKILHDTPKPLTELRPHISPELDQVVRRCLEKEPANRFPTVAELAVSLADFAPIGARIHVERITRVMQAAGLSQSSLTNARAQNVTAPWSESGLPAQAAHAGAQTTSAWDSSDTSTSAPMRKGIWIWIAVGTGALMSIGLAAMALAGSPGEASPSEISASPTAAAAPAVIPVPPAGPSPSASPASVPKAPSAIPASDAGNAEVKRLPEPPRSKSPPRSASRAESPRKSSVLKSSEPPRETAEPPKAATGRTGFGSRK